MRPAALVLTGAIALTAIAPSPVLASRPAEPPSSSHLSRVLAISVDGLNTRAIRRLGRDGAPTFHRLLREGAGTLNARTEYEQNVTLPNHTSMLTSRRIDRRHRGHGVTWDDDRRRMTVQRGARHPVASVFTVVRAAGGSTALFSTKAKFRLYKRSWPAGIRRFRVDEDQRRLVRLARTDLVTHDRAFTFLHVSLPDRAGHRYGGMSAQYLRAVRTTDRQLGTILTAVDRRPALSRTLTVVLTADHGFTPGRTTHTPRILANYRIPFVAWGAQVRHGNLYDLNARYRNPGVRRPAYAARRQPVRNGDLGNLALDLLGLRSIAGSTLNAGQTLDVR